MLKYEKSQCTEKFCATLRSFHSALQKVEEFLQNTDYHKPTINIKNICTVKTGITELFETQKTMLSTGYLQVMCKVASEQIRLF